MPSPRVEPAGEPAADDVRGVALGGGRVHPLARRLLLVMWPAFLMAGVLEMMTFAVVDPTLHWFDGEPFGWSRSAVYSVTFFIYWGAMTASGLITQLLCGGRCLAAGEGPSPRA